METIISRKVEQFFNLSLSGCRDDYTQEWVEFLTPEDDREAVHMAMQELLGTHIRKEMAVQFDSFVPEPLLELFIQKLDDHERSNKWKKRLYL